MVMMYKHVAHGQGHLVAAGDCPGDQSSFVIEAEILVLTSYSHNVVT